MQISTNIANGRQPLTMHRDQAHTQNPRWAAPPRYLLRIALVLERLRQIDAKSALEIGFGGGDLLDRLAREQVVARGIEISPEAFELSRQRFAGRTNPQVELGDFFQAHGAYDVLLAFEVLEHIEDHEAVICKWRDLVRPGGHVLFSVPAHMRRWSYSDDAVGHVRRYEKEQLVDLLTRHGLDPVRIDCYGFPLANLVAPIQTMASRTAVRRLESPSELTKQSGISRRLARRVRWLCNPVTIWPWAKLQKLFLETELGNGYLILARRPQQAAAA